MTTRPPNNRHERRFFALIPCAGQGSRASLAAGAIAKQYQLVAGQAMVRHTLAAFAAAGQVSAVWVVVAPGDIFFQTRAGNAFSVADCGGATRAQSVGNGLAALRAAGADDEDWVLVHDAARCLITPEQIEQLIEACADDAVGGLLALPLPDTLKSGAHGRVVATLDRADKWLAQTPQMFRLGMLAQALAAAGAGVTDEASAIEALGHSPRLVTGSAQNFKVTYPDDFALAEAVLQSRRARA